MIRSDSLEIKGYLVTGFNDHFKELANALREIVKQLKG